MSCFSAARPVLLVAHERCASSPSQAVELAANVGDGGDHGERPAQVLQWLEANRSQVMHARLIGLASSCRWETTGKNLSAYSNGQQWIDK